MQGTRWKNRPHIGEWEQAIAAGRLPATDIEHLTPEQRAGELAMLRLRLAPGIDFVDFKARMGFDAKELFAERFEQFSALGLVKVDDVSARLTEKGWDVVDTLAGELLV